MLSGVGDKYELAKLDIDSVHHLPGVGKNLEDHFFLHADWQGRADDVDWTDPSSIANNGAFGYFKAPAVLASPSFTSLPENVQQHCKRPTVPQWELASLAMPSQVEPGTTMYGIYIFTMCPQSRGTITLASTDPSVAPLIDPNFFDHPFDRACAVAAGRGLLEYVDTPALKDKLIKPLNVPKSDSEEDLLDFWRVNATSTWHPACTVKMGQEGEKMACVGSDFRVLGLEGLRVADMSVTPFLPNCKSVPLFCWVYSRLKSR
jgi:choline dehydrogenase-like flavoprotein